MSRPVVGVNQSEILWQKAVKEWIKYRSWRASRKQSHQKDEIAGTRCKKDWKYLNNIREDFRKKLGNKIATLADEYNVKIVIGEYLEGAKKDKYKKENDLLALWAPQKIKELIKVSLEEVGAVFFEVSAEDTSQLDPRTRGYAARPKEDKRVLYTKEGIKLDADEAACDNLMLRFLERGFNDSKLKAVPTNEGEYKIKFTLNKDSGETKKAEIQKEKYLKSKYKGRNKEFYLVTDEKDSEGFIWYKLEHKKSTVDEKITKSKEETFRKHTIKNSKGEEVVRYLSAKQSKEYVKRYIPVT